MLAGPAQFAPPIAEAAAGFLQGVMAEGAFTATMQRVHGALSIASCLDQVYTQGKCDSYA